MDIGSKKGYPASALSNFAPHKFVFEGVECNSMEGFLQGLKFANHEMQKEVCKLTGLVAKRKGAKKGWKRDQTLYWKGFPIDRQSDAYQGLLDSAYLAMFGQSDSFRNALKAAGKATFTHSIGRTDSKETVLTNQEFISRLNWLRNML